MSSYLNRWWTTALLALTLTAGAVTTPQGWTSQNQSGATMLTPANLPAGQTLVMLVFPAQPLNGLSLQAWTQNVVQQGTKQYGKVLQADQLTFKDPFWTSTQVVEVKGKPMLLTFYAAAAGQGKAQLVTMLMSSEKSVAERYAGDIAGVVAGVFSGNPVAVAKGTAGTGSTGSTALAEQYGLPRGSKVGGTLQIGTYNCTRPGRGDGDPWRFTLDLYENQQWREAIDGRQINWSKYEYNANTGKMTISMDLKLYNSEFDEDVFSIYYTNAQGRSIIYGEDDYGLGVDRTTCLYAGPNKLPSPTEVMAQDEKKEAAKAMARAEANRFKWITAPGKGVQLNQIQALLYDGPGQYQDVSSKSRDPEIILLMKDGWGYTGLRVSPHDLDVKKSRQNEPKEWFKWRRQGNAYHSLDPQTNQWNVIVGEPVIAPKVGEKLSGSFIHTSFSNNSSGPSYSDRTISFSANGTFDEAGISKSASSLADSIYQGSTTIVGSTYSKDGCSISSQASAGHTAGSTATVNSNAITQQNCGADNIGKYTVNGYTLELLYASGRVIRTFLYFKDAKKQQIGIGYSIYGPKK